MTRHLVDGFAANFAFFLQFRILFLLIFMQLLKEYQEKGLGNEVATVSKPVHFVVPRVLSRKFKIVESVLNVFLSQKSNNDNR